MPSKKQPKTKADLEADRKKLEELYQKGKQLLEEGSKLKTQPSPVIEEEENDITTSDESEEEQEQPHAVSEAEESESSSSESEDEVEVAPPPPPKRAKASKVAPRQKKETKKEREERLKAHLESVMKSGLQEWKKELSSEYMKNMLGSSIRKVQLLTNN